MSTLSEFNKFNILGPQMRSFLFSILFAFFAITSFAQNTDAKSNSLGSCGLTQTNVWSNFSNQAGLAEITQFAVGVGTKNSFGIKELSTHAAVFALPVSGGVFGLNIAYTGFDLYNETKIGLAFGKKLSESFNVGVQVDYLGIYADGSTNNKNNFTFEIGAQKKLMRDLTLGAHIFNPISVKLNEDEVIPSIFKLGLGYNANRKVSIFTETELENGENGMLKVGLEYKIIEQLQLRTGFSTNPSKNSFGIGYTLDNIQFDIVVNRHQLLGYSPQFSVSSTF
ncbi:MAG: hypothetical protein H8E84_08115 [Flavobacteriales bacterium]|nr:hypothetical protein [Flavobacteriales bacterium]